MNALLAEKQEAARKLDAELSQLRDQLARERAAAQRRQQDEHRALAEKEAHLQQARQDAARSQAELEETRKTLRYVQNTRGWRYLERYRALRNALEKRTRPLDRRWRGWLRAWRALNDSVAYQALPLTRFLEAARKETTVPSLRDAVRVMSAQIAGEDREAIFAHPDTDIYFTLRLPPRPRFATGIGILPDAWMLNGTGVDFALLVADNGQLHPLARRQVAPSRRLRDRRWRPLSLDLHPRDGKEVTLVLRTTTPPGGSSDYGFAVWGAPRILGRRSLAQQARYLQETLSTLGLRGLLDRLRAEVNKQPLAASAQELYSLWRAKHESDLQDTATMHAEIARFRYNPTISIITPVYNTDPRWLKKCLDSVLAQAYPNWELCLCDDGSTDPRTRPLLARYQGLDARVKVIYSEVNQGIAAASNQALSLATGEFVALLDHDDELSPHALFEVAKLLQRQPDADIVYSDEDKLDENGDRTDPFFKPDWSPEYLLSCMYTCHLGVYRKAPVDAAGGFRPGFDGSQDYDLMLRLTERTHRVHHIPRILYHWRMCPTSAAGSTIAKPHAHEAGKKALKDHLQRQGVQGEVLDGKWTGHYRVKCLVNPRARVSIIIPTRDKAKILRTCVESIKAKTSYPNYEILVVDNDSADTSACEYLAHLSHRVLRLPGNFNFSKINNFAAKHAKGEYLVFLNNDTEVISPDWLQTMLEFCREKDVGVVGAKLLYADGTIQHAGVVLGLGGVAGHALSRLPATSPHYFGIADDVRNCSAVTAACMMVRREAFDQVAGFDETNLPVAFNDVDFCLRVREQGYRIVWTPYAELYHHESVSRGYSLDPKEIAFMKHKWGAVLRDDPFYNRNLTLERGDFSLRL